MGASPQQAIRTARGCRLMIQPAIQLAGSYGITCGCRPESDTRRR